MSLTMSESDKELWAAIDSVVTYILESAPEKYKRLEEAMKRVEDEERSRMQFLMTAVRDRGDKL